MTVQLIAHAKLTWNLEVTGVRADGYHLLRSEMVSVALHDELAITEVVDGSGSHVRYVSDDVDVSGLADGRDLVSRALELAGRQARVAVRKRIPLGGGLGGGSADAAAILRWAKATDFVTASRLGGDVPFCLTGGRAVVEGIGERVQPLPYEHRAITLFLPPFGVNTAAVYRRYDERAAAGLAPTGRNYLRDAAVDVEPRLGQFEEWVRANYATPVLAGSGSTIFVEGHCADRNQVVASPVGEVRVVVTETTPAAS